MTLTLEEQELLKSIENKLEKNYGRTSEDATPMQIYKAIALTVRDDIMAQWAVVRKERKHHPVKLVYYLSFEFLMGRALGNNLINLQAYDKYKHVLDYLGVDINLIEEQEKDEALGNGGLGRLAACFLDSFASLGYPAYGCGIRYEYGLFKQKIVNGYQTELPDEWLDSGIIWEIETPEEAVEIKFGGNIVEYVEDGRLKFKVENSTSVIAVPYDMPIIGYKRKTVNSLRLWSARSPVHFDMESFSAGDYAKAGESKALAEVLSKVLYPEDAHIEGKQLRLKQEFFFTSATLQWLISRLKARKLTVLEMPNYISLQINDTHPTIAIAELMRLLIDEEGLGWDTAWDICQKCFSYTNHTIMAEALESWSIDIVKELLPRQYMIIEEIHRRTQQTLIDYFGYDWDRINKLSVLSYGRVHMANLCIHCCHKVNGVSQLHAEILKNNTFRDFYFLYPNKFIGITNGVTHRRWLCHANKELSDLISRRIGPEWIENISELSKLEKFADDKGFLKELKEIRRTKKEAFAKYLKNTSNIDIDPDSIFDTQVKRLHEYKRQLMNVLRIIYYYYEIKDGTYIPPRKRTFIFGAKAAPGYYRAKLIIKLINNVAEVVNNDPVVSKYMQVVFVEDYGVSIAEKLIPATDITQQISTAGKEASGTSNMKFMMNGGIILGTLDGANVEIKRAVGPDNIAIFGLKAEEVNNLYHVGNMATQEIYASNPKIRRVLDSLLSEQFTQDKPNLFREIFNSLIFGDHGFPDPYMVIKDLEEYIEADKKLVEKYENEDTWYKMATINIARSGIFSSDRTINEYNEKIWKLK